MNFIRRIFMKEQPRLLGRWKITYENNHLANHDHCGPCGIINYEKKEIGNSKDEKEK